CRADIVVAAAYAAADALAVAALASPPWYMGERCGAQNVFEFRPVVLAGGWEVVPGYMGSQSQPIGRQGMFWCFYYLPGRNILAHRSVCPACRNAMPQIFDRC